jgi:5'-3' exonuclease
MRESVQFQTPVKCPRGVQKDTDVVGFKFLNVNLLRNYIIQFMSRNNDMKDHHDAFMFDYVFVCFFLGNDFLPHFPSFALKHNGLDIIFHTYRTIFEKRKDHIILYTDGQYSINMQFLEEFIEHLAQQEVELFKTNVIHYYESPVQEKTFKTPLEQYTYNIDFMPILNKKSVIDVTTSDIQWKSQYYDMFFNVQYNDMRSIDHICENFLTGLHWNVDYYFNLKTSDTWHYMYNAPPFIGDLDSFLKKQYTSLSNVYNSQKNELHAKHDTQYLTALHQLLIVLPYQSHHMLPSHVREKLHDISRGCVDMYPISFQINSFLKTQLWECTPNLPPIDLSKVFSILNTP